MSIHPYHCLFIRVSQTFTFPAPSTSSLSPLHRVVFGNSNGLAVVDYIQKTVVLNLGTVELYGSNDPYQRQPRSPRKTRQPSGGNQGKRDKKWPERKTACKIFSDQTHQSTSTFACSISAIHNFNLLLLISKGDSYIHSINESKDYLDWFALLLFWVFDNLLSRWSYCQGTP